MWAICSAKSNRRGRRGRFDALRILWGFNAEGAEVTGLLL